ncbi:unnamed protein product [Caenorhabditis brenneri]
MPKLDFDRIWNDDRKFTYFFYTNAFLLLCGLASLVVGIWLYSSKNIFIELTPSSYSALSAAGLCVFSGVTICIIVGVGYLGVAWGNKPLLYSYIAFMILLILVHGVARITGFLHKDEARENLRTSMLYNINTTHVLTKIGRKINLQITWDHLQTELECCGVDHYTDWYWSVHWPNNQYVPDSCCDPLHFNQNSSVANCGKMPEDDSILYQEGCFPKFADWLYHHIILVNWVTSILFVIEMILLILSVAVLIVLKEATASTTSSKTRSPRRRDREQDPDSSSERIRLNSMDRIGDAREDGASINSR